MMVERYPNLKEEVGGLNPDCEISPLLDIILPGAQLPPMLWRCIYQLSVSKEKKKKKKGFYWVFLKGISSHSTSFNACKSPSECLPLPHKSGWQHVVSQRYGLCGDGPQACPISMGLQLRYGCIPHGCTQHIMQLFDTHCVHESSACWHKNYKECIIARFYSLRRMSSYEVTICT